MRHILILLSLALLPLTTSCLAAAVAAGAVGYIQYDKNEAWRDFEHDIEDVWRATLAGLRKEGYEVEERPAPAGEAVIEIDDVWVKVERHPDDRVRVRVRVGTFTTADNQRRAKLILESIGRRI